MADSWILNLTRPGDGGPVLIQVSCHGDALDLDLLATEGELPYRGKIRRRKTADLRAKTFHGSEQEWESILLHVFNPLYNTDISSTQRSNFETLVAISKGKMIITLRNRVDQITQRLGSVELHQDDDAEIQLFEWCNTALNQAQLSASQNIDLRSQHTEAEAAIASLTTKLEELVAAKIQHEDELVSKFVLLLNEKKLKIRNQQRLLSTADIDKAQIMELEKAEAEGRKALSSRAGKRGRGQTDDESSDDAFEALDADNGRQAEGFDNASERQTTPETGSATEDDIASTAVEKPTRSTRKRQRTPQDSSSPEAPKRAARVGRLPQRQSPSPGPPSRKAPFAKKTADSKATERTGATITAAPSKTMESGDETETDDEL